MIYEMHTYQMNLSGRAEFLRIFHESLVPLLPRLGFKLLGAWVTYIGAHSSVEFIWLLEFQDLAHREHAFNTLHADQEFQAFAEKLRSHLSDVDVRILEPVDFSPMK